MKKLVTIAILMGLIAISLLQSVSAQVAPSLDEGLVLYLPFDEGSGTTAIDESVNLNNGTISNGVYSEGKFGTALEFNGVSSSVVVPHISAYDLVNLTFSCWIKINATSGEDPIIIKDFGTSVYPFQIIYYNPTDKLLFQIFSGDWHTVGSFEGLVPNEQWIFILVTFSRPTIHIYLNNVDGGNVAFDFDLPTNTANINIGFSNAGGVYTQGIIDDLRLYNRVLSQSEITFLYENPQPTPTPAPSVTPIPQDMATSAIMSTIILVILVITNIVFLGVVHSAMVRFLFALLTLMIGIASLTVQNITFNPYLQMVTVVMSLLCMILAAKAKG